MLGTLKGGAMKFGQALSVYEAAIPDEYAAPYREALTKLQNAAPPMPPATVHRLMAAAVRHRVDGRGSPSSTTTRRRPPASARCTGRSGRTAARSRSSCSTPGAEAALRADLDQLFRVAPLLGVVVPGHADAAAAGRAARPDPGGAGLRPGGGQPTGVRRGLRRRPGLPGAPGGGQRARRSIVSEWVEGISLGKIIASGTTEQRDRAGSLLTELHFAAPERVGLLHADPHPGNYMLTADGRLARHRLRLGRPAARRRAADHRPGDPARPGRSGRRGARRRCATRDSSRPTTTRTPSLLMDYVVPFIEPLRHETFHFTRAWMQAAGGPDVELLQRGVEDGPAA